MLCERRRCKLVWTNPSRHFKTHLTWKDSDSHPTLDSGLDALASELIIAMGSSKGNFFSLAVAFRLADADLRVSVTSSYWSPEEGHPRHAAVVNKLTSLGRKYITAADCLQPNYQLSHTLALRPRYSRKHSAEINSFDLSAVWSAFYDFVKHKNILARYLHRGMGSMENKQHFKDANRIALLCERPFWLSICFKNAIPRSAKNVHQKCQKQAREQWPMNSQKLFAQISIWDVWTDGDFSVANSSVRSLCSGSFKNQLLVHDRLGASRIFGEQTSWKIRESRKRLQSFTKKWLFGGSHLSQAGHVVLLIFFQRSVWINRIEAEFSV